MEELQKTENMNGAGPDRPVSDRNADYESLYKDALLRLDEYRKALDESKAASVQYMNRYIETEIELRKITDSRFYKVMRKYYAVRERLIPNGSRRHAVFEFLLRPFRKRLKPELPKGDLVDMKLDPNAVFERFKTFKRIDILTIRHTAYVAVLMQKKLTDAGIECCIHSAEPEVYDDIPYILICPHCYRKLPEIYVAFQMEQSVSPRWLNERYFEILRGAYAVLDYSVVNIEYFSRDPLIAGKLYYVPVDYCPVLGDPEDDSREYDVLFYGDIDNEHRRHVIDTIGKKYSVKICYEIYGEELYREIRKAKVVINVHYYTDALLETTRIYETLSLNSSVVVSERSCDPTEDARLEGIVDFVDAGDAEGMLRRVSYWIENDDARRERIKENRAALAGRPNAAGFYTNRFLLANDLIGFDDFYRTSSDYISLEGDRVCLSMIESARRRKAFDADNRYGFRYFPGLRHAIGWVGCAMSYKFIFKKAVEQGFDRLLVCEDDVCFPDDFKERFDRVLEYVEKHPEYDIFSGIMADLGDAEVSGVEEYKGETFVALDRVISMVFNLYDKRVFETIADWNEQDRVRESNTIDRYLESKRFKALTTCPFLTGHKEELDSTIWGMQNTMYSEMIERSSKKIRELVEEYRSAGEQE